MNKGYIITYGRYAITIQTEEKKQYIGFFEYCDDNVIDQIGHPLKNINVVFDIDRTRFSGETIYGKRYYALNVKLSDLII